MPLPFAPYFYELDFSEVPILIGSFIMGPVAGVIMELVKILLKLALKGSWTFGVGDLGNFLIGCSFIVPTAIIYRKIKGLKGMIIACVSGTLCLAVVGRRFKLRLTAAVLCAVYADRSDYRVGSLGECVCL